MSPTRVFLIAVLLSLDPALLPADPGAGRGVPECALTGLCASARRPDRLICDTPLACRTARAEWVAQRVPGHAKGPTRATVPTASVPLPPSAGPFFVALVLLTVARLRRRD